MERYWMKCMHQQRLYRGKMIAKLDTTHDTRIPSACKAAEQSNSKYTCDRNVSSEFIDGQLRSQSQCICDLKIKRQHDEAKKLRILGLLCGFG